MKDSKSIGTVTVSKRAALQAAEYITKITPGVAALTDRSKRGEITRFFLNKGMPKGVYMTKTDKGIDLDIYIICSYGANTNELCKKISSSIRDELSGNMGMPVNRVTVRVEGVDTAVR